MDRVLGIDIGSYSVKLVVMHLDEHDCTIESCFEQKIFYSPEKDENQCKADAIKFILDAHHLQFHFAQAALSSDLTVAKKFEFYKLKRRDRQMVLENEFDSLGLFPMEEYGLEYHTIDYESDTTPLLGILFKKQALRDLISILSQVRLDPRVIDIDNMTYLNVIQFLHQDDKTHEIQSDGDQVPILTSEPPDLIVNIGHQKTSLTLIGKHKVLFSRSLNTAGKYFTLCLQKALNVSFEEAEIKKHELSQNSSSESHSDVGTDVLKKSYQELALEIMRTIQSFGATGSETVGRIFLTGSSSLYPQTESIFQDVIGLPVRRLELQSPHFHVKSQSGQGFCVETFCQSVAIGLRGSYHKNNSTMNLRHGEFSTTTNYDQVIEQIFLYGKIAAAIIVCLLGTYLFRYFAYDGKIKKMQSEYKKEISALFQTEPAELKVISRQKNWDFHEYSLHAENLIKENIKTKKDLIQKFGDDSVPLAIQVLDDLSTAVPKSVYFEVSEFKLTDHNLYVEADTDSTKAVDAIMADLKKIKSISNIEKKSQENKAGTAGQIIHFVFTAVVASE